MPWTSNDAEQHTHKAITAKLKRALGESRE
jgi:hypothetical protein